MGGLTSAFNLINTALDNDQQAIDVTANNVANAGTAGYTVESASWSQQDPVTIGARQWGTGTTAATVTSRRDLVLEARLHQQQQAQSAASTREQALTDLENVFGLASADASLGSTLDGGIGDSITGFFTSVSALAADPGSASARQQVLSAAGALAQSFNTAASGIAAQQTTLQGQVTADVSSANTLLSSIAMLNHQITATSPAADAGTLEDERQQDILSLSQLMGVSQVSTGGNGLELTTANGTVLVSDSTAATLTASTSATGTAVQVNGTDVTSQITGGSIGGELQVLGSDIPAVMSKLDTLANGVATQVNSVLAGGVDQNGAAGTALFSVPSAVAGSAAAISILMTDPAKLAAASAGGGSGDNSNANALGALSSAATVGGETPSEFYASMVSALGSSTQSATTQNTALTASLQQLTSQRDSLSGVSQDDEAAALQQYESAYQAASKVFSVLNTLMDTALNLGVAGVAAQ